MPFFHSFLSFFTLSLVSDDSGDKYDGWEMDIEFLHFKHR